MDRGAANVDQAVVLVSSTADGLRVARATATRQACQVQDRRALYASHQPIDGEVEAEQR